MKRSVVSSVGLLSAVAASWLGTLACETHIRVDEGSTTEWAIDVPPAPPDSGIADLGGTMAFQRSSLLPLADHAQIGTNLPHSEVDFYLGDPETNFTTISKEANWGAAGSIPVLVANATSAPVDNTPAVPSTWKSVTIPSEIQGPFGTVFPTLPFVSGVWRMDHGACSAHVSKLAILSAIGSQVPNESMFPFNVQMSKFEGVGYVAHPNGAAPTASNTGGLLLNLSGTARGNDLANAFSNAIASELLTLGAVGVIVRDVSFNATATVQMDVNAQGFLQMSEPSAPVVSTSDSGGCGCNLNFGLPLIECGICLDSQVSGGVSGGLSGIPGTGNPTFQACQAQPLPLGPKGGPLPCTTVNDCSSASNTLKEAVQFFPPPVANVGLDSAGNITGLQPDRTVLGLSSSVLSSVESALSTSNVNLVSGEVAGFVCATIPASCAAAGQSSEAPTPPSGKFCQYVLHAKRVSNYPDETEVVLFDEEDKVGTSTQNLSSLALFTALGSAVKAGQADAGTINTLCPAPQIPAQRIAPDFIRTSF
jgi:hypothetical protein